MLIMNYKIISIIAQISTPGLDCRVEEKKLYFQRLFTLGTNILGLIFEFFSDHFSVYVVPHILTFVMLGGFPIQVVGPCGFNL